MSRLRARSAPRALRRQRGFTLILGLLLVGLLGAAVFLSARQGAADQRAERAVSESLALGTVREALVAYALAGGTSDEHGALPCPDTDGDRITDGTSCQGGAQYLGRAPTATLDIEPGNTYGSDEIWYVVDHDFADWDPPERVNTGSVADLVVDGAGGFAAALILARDPLAGQDTRTNDVDDHLEDENADGDGEFASCDSDTCNDRVVGLTKDEVLDPVRRRVLGAVRDALEGFFADNGYYPWAAPLGEPDGACDDGRQRGSLPVDQGSCVAGEYLDSVSEGGHLPDWIEDNQWHHYVYYAVSDPCSPAGSGCSAGAVSLLSLAGSSGQAVVFATVGEPIVSAAKGAMQDRSGTPPRDVIEYLDSPENTDGDDVFDDPENGTGENDRLRAIAAP